MPAKQSSNDEMRRFWRQFQHLGRAFWCLAVVGIGSAAKNLSSISVGVFVTVITGEAVNCAPEIIEI